MSTHNTKKAYWCPICKKSYAESAGLFDHVKARHPQIRVSLKRKSSKEDEHGEDGEEEHIDDEEDGSYIAMELMEVQEEDDDDD